jgi:hypothetical protein
MGGLPGALNEDIIPLGAKAIHRQLHLVANHHIDKVLSRKLATLVVAA